MAYEKPKLIDLSEQKEHGFGNYCSDGSGAGSCITGPNAASDCDNGIGGLNPK